MYLSFGGTNCAEPLAVRHVVIDQRVGSRYKTTVFIPDQYLQLRNDAVMKRVLITPEQLRNSPDIAIVRLYGADAALDLSLPWNSATGASTAPSRAFLNKICYKSSQKFEDNNFYTEVNKYVYDVGYGFKGKTETRTQDGELTWLKLSVGTNYAINVHGEIRYRVIERHSDLHFFIIDDTVYPRPAGWSGRDAAGGDSGSSIVYYVNHNMQTTGQYRAAPSKAVAVGVLSGGPREYGVINEYVNVQDDILRGALPLLPGYATRVSRQLQFIEESLKKSASLKNTHPKKVLPPDSHPIFCYTKAKKKCVIS